MAGGAIGSARGGGGPQAGLSPPLPPTRIECSTERSSWGGRGGGPAAGGPGRRGPGRLRQPMPAPIRTARILNQCQCSRVSPSWFGPSRFDPRPGARPPASRGRRLRWHPPAAHRQDQVASRTRRPVRRRGGFESQGDSGHWQMWGPNGHGGPSPSRPSRTRRPLGRGGSRGPGSGPGTARRRRWVRAGPAPGPRGPGPSDYRLGEDLRAVGTGSAPGRAHRLGVWAPDGSS